MYIKKVNSKFSYYQCWLTKNFQRSGLFFKKPFQAVRKKFLIFKRQSTEIFYFFVGFFLILKKVKREYSSVGRASSLHGECQRFESAYFHQLKKLTAKYDQMK